MVCRRHHTQSCILTHSSNDVFSSTGCMVVAVVAAESPWLATLTRFCRAALLSNVSLGHAAHLPPEATWTEGVLPNLLYFLSSLSNFATTASQLSSLPASTHPLLFNLSLLHCTLHHHCRLAESHPPGLPLFLSSLSLLCSFTSQHQLQDIVRALQTHATTVYSTCCSGLVLEGLVTGCLDSSAVLPGSSLSLPLGESGTLELVTPGPGVTLSNYGDHVMGVMSSEAQKTADTMRYVNFMCIYICKYIFPPSAISPPQLQYISTFLGFFHSSPYTSSKCTLSTAVFKLLIPTLLKLPDYTSSTPSPSPNSTLTASPSHPHPHSTTSKTTSPRPTPTPRRPQGTVWTRGEGEVRGADICSQLPSSHNYLDYIWSQVSHMNHICSLVL